MKSFSKIFRFFNIVLLLGTYLSCSSQFQTLPTNTSASLLDLSVFKNNVMIGGFNDYLGISKNSCQNIYTLSLPGPSGCVTRIKRIDTNEVFVLNYSPSQTYFYESKNGGNNWFQKSVTAGSFSHYYDFFDSLVGLRTDGPFLENSLNGGTTWSTITCPFTVGTSVIKVFGDSLVCLAGVNALGNGLILSKNRGKTWLNGWGLYGHNVEITGFSIISSDTIIAVGTGGLFVFSNDGGITWNDTSEPPLFDFYDAIKINSNGIYLVGVSSEGYGVIAKTEDFGKSWKSLNTGIKTTLQNIETLDENTLLISGTNGVLLTWAFKNSVFTKVSDNSLTNSKWLVYPNPVKDKITVEINQSNNDIHYIMLFDELGRILITSEINQKSNELSLKGIENGFYYLKIRSGLKEQIVKVVKE